MGRELKRVPLDFAQPLNERWHGFVNPHHTAVKCPYCAGTGSSPTARHLKDQWYGYAEFHPEDRGSVPFAVDHPHVRALAERNFTHADALEQARALREHGIKARVVKVEYTDPAIISPARYVATQPEGIRHA